MRFLYSSYFWLLSLLPLLWFCYLWSWNQKRKWLKEFGNISWPWRKLRVHIPISLGLVLAILALTRPQYALQVTYLSREGIDLVCGIDVSPSMLAEDVIPPKKTLIGSLSGGLYPSSFLLSPSANGGPVLPNRLQRVKQAMYDLTQILRGERVALFLFSSRSSKILPLSSDYNSLRFYLDFYLDSYHISARGTDLKTAISLGTSLFQEDSRYKVLVLFSDGEMEEEDALKKAVEEAQSAWLNEKVRIYTFGVGSEQSVLIPIRNQQGSISGYLKDGKGNFVRTQASPASLIQIAQAGGGQFYSLGEYRSDASMDKAVLRFMENVLAHAQDLKTIQKTRTEYRDLFPYLFLLALGVSGGKSLISEILKLITGKEVK
jgi:hypothetical protein